MIGINTALRILVYLTALIGLLPVLPYLPLWVQAALGLGFVLGLGGDRRNSPLLGDKVATLLTIGFFLQFILQVSFANLVTPLINFLCLLLAIRLAGDKTSRHILQTFLLATIILAASSMLTLNLAFLIYLILIVLLVTSGLVLLSFHTTDPTIALNRQQWHLLLKTAALLPIASLALMLVFFVILPRTQMPLWNFLNPTPRATAGMTDQVRPGSVAELSDSAEVAFRAETEQLPQDALYWRGIVLNQIDGSNWTRGKWRPAEGLISVPASETLLTIYSEPKADRYLVSIDRPAEIKGIRHNSAADGVINGHFRDQRKVRYEVRAQLNAESRQTGNTSRYLDTPAQVDERLREIAREIAAEPDFKSKKDNLDRFFLQQQLRYSAERLPATVDPVSTFLFETRRGYCEYFASSYALLLRLAGVPARLVGGYLGGEYNQLGGYYLIKEDAAHVWVEALDDQELWQRIDPSRLAQNSEDAFARSSGNRLSKLQILADTVTHYWTQVVLNYDLRQQFGLLRNLVTKARELKRFDKTQLQPLLHLAWLIPPALIWYLLRRRKNRGERLLNQYRKLIAKAAGLDSLPPSVGLFTIAKASNQPLCTRFAETYGASFYNDRNLTSGELHELQSIMRRLRKQGSELYLEDINAEMERVLSTQRKAGD